MCIATGEKEMGVRRCVIAWTLLRSCSSISDAVATNLERSALDTLPTHISASGVFQNISSVVVMERRREDHPIEEDRHEERAPTTSSPPSEDERNRSASAESPLLRSSESSNSGSNSVSDRTYEYPSEGNSPPARPTTPTSPANQVYPLNYTRPTTSSQRRRRRRRRQSVENIGPPRNLDQNEPEALAPRGPVTGTGRLSRSRRNRTDTFDRAQRVMNQVISEAPNEDLRRQYEHMNQMGYVADHSTYFYMFGPNTTPESEYQP